MSLADHDANEPVRVFQDDTGDRFLIYGTEGGIRVELRAQGDSLWMSQAQMADLFGRDVSVISRHISNVLEEGELPEAGNLQKMQIAGVNKPTTLYSLDVIISVGYRVSSTQATLFRRWATAVLVKFATKGFVVDSPRLKSPGEHDRVAELREIVRDIRASEANVYAELRRICALCSDYDPRGDASRTFYQRTQAKLFWAVTNRTPSMILAERADAAQPNMGLRAWPKDDIRQQDALVAKNYLGELEIRELNRLTTILLDIFEDQLEIGRLTLMFQASDLLDQQLRNLNRVVLQRGGDVAHVDAEAAAKRAYKAFDANRKASRKAEAEREYAALKAEAKALLKGRRTKPGPS